MGTVMGMRAHEHAMAHDISPERAMTAWGREIPAHAIAQRMQQNLSAAA